MKCPYCASEVPREAVVCATCRRDFYLLKPLLGRVAELEEQVATLTDELDRLRPADVVSEIATEAPAPQSLTIGEWLAYWGLPLLLLLLAHYLIIIRWDWQVLHLHVAALLLPLPFGYFLWSRSRRSMGVTVLAALGMALSAVLGMSAVTGAVDQVPVLPASTVEWREFLEFSASILFSYLTGVVLGQRELKLRERLNGEMLLKVARWIHGGAENARKVQDTVKKLNDMATTAAAAATTGVSLYAGLKGLVG